MAMAKRKNNNAMKFEREDGYMSILASDDESPGDIKLSKKSNVKNMNQNSQSEALNISKSDSKSETRRKKREKLSKEERRLKIKQFFRAAMWRISQYMLTFFITSVLALVFGSMIIPFVAYELSAGANITQSTNFYVAIASWIAPLVFYTAAITALGIAVIKKINRKLSDFATKMINKQKEND